MLRIVNTENGLVEGIPAADPRITAFKGVPFAAAPIGENRWRAPQKAENWSGVKKCFTFAPICVQETPGLDPNAFYSKEWHVDPEIPMSEDCLYLNVWTPAKSADEKLPVLVWIFGGGSQGGYTAEMEFDGERIARRGVILVSINYRCNSFGYLAHPKLLEEAPEAFGNYGLFDQKFGIEWVKRNIAAFGGNPQNITISGQSAGAAGVLAHLTSPKTKGLFQKVIIQSAGGFRGYAQGPTACDKDKALLNGIEFFKHLGVNTLEEARAIDEKTLMEKTLSFKCIQRWGPIVDGVYLPCDTAETMAKGEYHKVPMLYGNTSGEYTPGSTQNPETLEALAAWAKFYFNDEADKFLALCDVKTDDEVHNLTHRDPAFITRCVSNLSFAQYQAKAPETPNYLYYFDPVYPGDGNGECFHSSDLWFSFETLAKSSRPFTGKYYDLARIMCNYWTNFCKTGDPNGSDADGSAMPQWKTYTEEHPFVMRLNEEKTGECPSLLTPLMNFFIDYIGHKYIERIQK